LRVSLAVLVPVYVLRCSGIILLITSAKADVFSSLFVCLSVCLSVSRTDLHETFREGWQWSSKQIIKFWWRSGSPSGYRDCFPDLSSLGVSMNQYTNQYEQQIYVR